ncbi:glycine--tRNA ligase [Candidatus Woesearchaeota archaeon]|nr:glycine--tRNA ligase [Candidatus Woesearchaeota archaeon]
MDNKHLQDVLAFSAQKGFVWGPSPEIYGGMAGFYTYGPLGKLLKNNIEQAIRTTFMQNMFMEVECPTIMPEQVWKASGHLGNFSDPVVTCSKCHATFRADHVLLAEEEAAEPSDEELLKRIPESKCPSCGGEFENNITRHDLMMKTNIGLDQTGYLRPETATTTYLPFLRYTEFFRTKLPFGVFQIGKAYRNEISPRQYLLRVREFTQAEAQWFVDPDKKNDEFYSSFDDEKLPFWSWNMQKLHKEPEIMTVKEAFDKKLFNSKVYGWTLALAYNVFLNMGVPAEKMRLRQHGPDEKAFYAADAWDVEVQLNSFGWYEMCGIHDRTDYDLTQHAKFSKKELYINIDGKKIVPHVLEIAFGVDRPTFILLDLFYDKKHVTEGKSVFRVPASMSPYQVGIFPLQKKDGLPELARKVMDDLHKEFRVFYDESGSIGKRYLRAAEDGTPYCITVDYDSKDKDTCTIRDRDTEEQKIVKITDLNKILADLISYKVVFKDLK